MIESKDSLSIGVLPGGGTLGLISVYMMEAFEEKSGRLFHEQFDQLDAVSVGSINASCTWPLEQTGEPLMPISQLKDFYLNKIGDAFDPKFWSLGGLLDNKYDIEDLEKMIDEIYGDLKLSDYKDGLHIYVVDVESQNYKKLSSDAAKLDPSEDYYMKDVIRTAISAPYYFEPVRIRNMAGEVKQFVDGGVWQSNPAFTAYFDALMKTGSDKNIVMTTFGTGHTRSEEMKLEDLDGGARELPNAITLAFNIEANVTDKMLQNRLGSRYVMMDTDISGSGLDMITRDVRKILPYAERAVEGNELQMQKALCNISGIRGYGLDRGIYPAGFACPLPTAIERHPQPLTLAV